MMSHCLQELHSNVLNYYCDTIAFDRLSCLVTVRAYATSSPDITSVLYTGADALIPHFGFVR